MKKIYNIFAVFTILGVFAISSNAQTSLRSLDGESVNVQGQSGKAVVLAVGASWLPLSVKQAEYTNALARRYAGKNVVVYFIFTDSNNTRSKNYASDEELRAWVAKNRLSVKALRDPDGASTLRKFGIDQLPSLVVLDKSGDRSGEVFGGIDPNYDITIPISRKVDSLL